MAPKEKAASSSSESKTKPVKQRSDGPQQLSLSSFFKGPSTTKTDGHPKKEVGATKGKAVKKTVGAKSGKSQANATKSRGSGQDQGVISIDDSSEDDSGILEVPQYVIGPVGSEARASQGTEGSGPRLSDLATNGLLSAGPPELTLAASAESGNVKLVEINQDIIEVESSDSEIEAGESKTGRKRKASSPPGTATGTTGSKHASVTKRTRPSTPPLSTPSGSNPGTPSKMLKLTAPLNPSPSKRQRTHDVLQSGEIKSEAPGDIKPMASIFGGASSSRALPVISATAANNTAPTLDFDTDPFLFRPEDVDITQWPGGRLPYEVLVGVYLQVGGTRSRLAIVRIISNFIRLLIHHSPADLLPTIYLLSNHLKPSYVPLELGIGSQVLTKATQEVSGVGRDVLKRLWDKHGDPGDVAFEAKSNLRTLMAPTPLSVHVLYSQLLKIASIKGSGAAKSKGDIVKKLLVQTKGEEVRYLVRTLVRHLRIGAVRLTLLSSLARAFVLSRPRGYRNLSDAMHATAEELDQVRPIPIKGGAKGKGKAKEEPDTAREILEQKCVEGVAVLRRVYVRHPNYDDILAALLAGGLDNIEERVPISVGIPLSPMLGSITRSLNEVYTRLGTLPFTAEAKLDGQRVQIHARIDGPSGSDDGGGRWIQSTDGGQKVWVRLFSRHLEDMTEKYPDILGLMSAIINRPLPATTKPFPEAAHLTKPDATMLELLATRQITSFIIDAEVVALDKDTGAFRTFQDLSNRAKKDVKVEDIKVIVGVFSFDLMLLNDESLLGQPFSIRRHLLRTLFEPFFSKTDATIARFGHVESTDSTKPEDVQAFFEQVVSQKCEGLMVKLLESGEGLTGEDDDAEDEDNCQEETKGKVKGKGGRKKPLPSTYEPDARSQGWLKVKKDYLEGVGDTLDLVPIGAWHGLGRKAGWWSPILLAAYNPETGALEAVCKCLAGFTDVFYKELLEKYPPTGKPEMSRKTGPYSYCETGGLTPDIWFNPQEVWQMAAADITSSPVYTAGASFLGSERGVSLRFPRFISVREDKGIEEATSAEQLADMYRQQSA